MNHAINGKKECVGNGGLSLRKKSKMIEIMEKQGINDYPEDIYFHVTILFLLINQH